MTSPLLTLISNDVRLQSRNGIYYAYGFVLVAYVALLFFFSEQIPSWVAAVAIYSDPSVLGYFFLGALMLLEKSEGTRIALAITPMRAMQYYWSKTIALTAVSLIAVTIIGLALHDTINWVLFISTTTMISVTYISVGFPVALLFRTATSYLMGSAVLLLPLVLPMLFALIDPMPIWAFIFPAATQFRLVAVSLGTFDASLGEITVLLLITILFTGLSIWFGIRALKKEFGQI